MELQTADSRSIGTLNVANNHASVPSASISAQPPPPYGEGQVPGQAPPVQIPVQLPTGQQQQQQQQQVQYVDGNGNIVTLVVQPMNSQSNINAPQQGVAQIPQQQFQAQPQPQQMALQQQQIGMVPYTSQQLQVSQTAPQPIPQTSATLDATTATTTETCNSNSAAATDKAFMDNIYNMRILKRSIIGVCFIYGAIMFGNVNSFFSFIHVLAAGLNILPLVPGCNSSLFYWNKDYYEKATGTGDDKKITVQPGTSYVCGGGCCDGKSCAFFWYWVVLYELVSDIAVVGMFMFPIFSNDDFVSLLVFGMIVLLSHEMVSIVCISDIIEDNGNKAISFWFMQYSAVVFTYSYVYKKELNEWVWTSSSCNGQCFSCSQSFQHPIGITQRCCIGIFAIGYIILGASL